MSTNLIKKISIKNVFGKVDTKNLKESTPLMRVVGIASGIKTGTTQYGDFVGLKGQFRAINLATGEEFHSGMCFMPDIAIDLVLPAIEANGSVEFGFDISVVPSDSEVGYEYRATPLIEPTEADPLEKLLSSMPKLPALDKPTAETSK